MSEILIVLETWLWFRRLKSFGYICYAKNKVSSLPSNITVVGCLVGKTSYELLNSEVFSVIVSKFYPL